MLNSMMTPRLQLLDRVLNDKLTNQVTRTDRTPVHSSALVGQNENLRSVIYYGGVHPNIQDVNGITSLQIALKNGRDDTAKLLIEYPGTLFNPPYRGDSLESMTKNEELQKMIKFKEKEIKSDLEYFEKFKQRNLGIIEEVIDYLILAIRMNDIQAIRACLLTYPRIKVVNTSKHYSTTPLTEAIQSVAGQKGEAYTTALNIVKLLLKTPGIDINTCSSTSEPILFWATSIGDVSVLELFLADPKLDPNQQDNMGYTALHDAVERGHINCVKRLLEDPRVDSSIINKHKKTAAELDGFNMNVAICTQEVLRHQQLLEQKKSMLFAKRTLSRKKATLFVRDPIKK